MTKSAMNTPATKNWRTSIGRLFTELVVVFIGVYAAFMLSEFRAEKQAEERRMQVVDALKTEIEEILFRAKRSSGGLIGLTAYYDSTIAAGAMPSLRPMIEPIRAESHMWEAALQSGGLNDLDVSTMYRLSQFYNVLNAGFEQLAQLRTLSETLIIPNLDQGPSAFYDVKTKKLLKKYYWYLDGLQRISALAEEVKNVGEVLVVDLEKAGAPNG